MVAPAQVLRYRLFSSVAIVWALALFGIEQMSASEVRRRVNPWRVVGATAARGWRSLSNWSEAAQYRELLPLRNVLRGTAREVAAAVSRALSALAPPAVREQSLGHQAVSGALHALMGITT